MSLAKRIGTRYLRTVTTGIVTLVVASGALGALQPSASNMSSTAYAASTMSADTVPSTSLQNVPLRSSLHVATNLNTNTVSGNGGLASIANFTNNSVDSVNLTGHVDFTGRGTPPNNRWVVPLSLTVRNTSTGAISNYSVTTDQSGNFTAAIPVAGTYDWYVVGPQMLANAGTAAVPSTVNMGTLTGGDANADNCVSAVDNSILRAAYGSTPGAPNWDARADFNADQMAAAADYSIMRGSYGMCGARPLVAYTPTATSTTAAANTATATRTATRAATSTAVPPTNTAIATRTATARPSNTPTPRSGGLPPIPAGLPTHFGYGLFNASISTMHSGVPYDYRYQYLAGGVNTGDGWRSWQGDGRYAASYVSATRAAGYIPGFIYYNILQSGPNYDEYSNLQSASGMSDYYNDWKALMQQSAGAGAIVIDVEPDLDGVMMQHSSNTSDNAALQPAKVGSSGMADVAGIADNFRGFWQALAHIRDLYAPNVVLGQDLSLWGADYDLTIALRNNPGYNWQSHADRTATYHNSFGPGYGLNFYSPLDRDCGYYETQQGSNRWWDENNSRQPTFNTMGAWLGRIDTATNKRALMWQVPNGNTIYRTENNTSGHYQDNRPQYFLNATTGRQHMQEWANYGVIGIMFGAGVGSQTHYFDSNNDGITNPAAINGNTQVSQYADDDGGYIRLNVGSYYSSGALPLP